MPVRRLRRLRTTLGRQIARDSRCVGPQMTDLDCFRAEALRWFDSHWRLKLKRTDSPTAADIDSYFARFKFLPESHRCLIGRGFRESLLKTVDGWYVQLGVGPREENPQYLLNRDAFANPSPEILVQTAVFVRLWPVFRELSLQPRFEYDDMDLTLERSRESGLLAFLEFKATDAGAARWLKNFQATVVGKVIPARPDQKRTLPEPIRKGISLADHRPRAFAVLGVDFSRFFLVQHHADRRFDLIDAGSDAKIALEKAIQGAA